MAPISSLGSAAANEILLDSSASAASGSDISIGSTSCCARVRVRVRVEQRAPGIWEGRWDGKLAEKRRCNELL
jgi:hypothetical protein